jgi:hypothetical protein
MSSVVATYSICPKISYVVYVLYIKGIINSDMFIWTLSMSKTLVSYFRAKSISPPAKREA